MVEPGSDGADGDPHAGPFSPAPAVEFSPDVDQHLEDVPAALPMDPGEVDPPPPASRPLFDRSGFAPSGFGVDEQQEGGGFAAIGRATAAGSFVGAQGALGAQGRQAGPDGQIGPGFDTASVHQEAPLWTTRPSETGELRVGARENGWLVVTAVLVAIFVAVTVGYTVLSASGSGRSRVEDAPLTRPDTDGVAAAPDPTAPDPTATPTTGVVAPPTTEAVGEWATFIAEDRSFKAEMPGTPTIVSANLGGPAVSYTAKSGGSTFRIITADLDALSDPEIDVALEAAASAAMDGAAVVGGPVTAYPGGIRVYDFRAIQDDQTVMGRSLAANGHRYVLTLTVPTAQAESPEVLKDLVRFRNGFLSTP